MATLFMLIAAVIALAVLGIFFPLLWIVAAALLVLGILYMWQFGREAARNR